MKRAEGGRSRGYTIFETMIFLAVSGAMFVSAAAFINGRQARTEFTSGTRDFESSINDLATDVATGYYDSGSASENNLRCSVGVANYPIITQATAERGGNKGCIFIGKTIQFAPNNNKQTYTTFSLAGLQFIGNNFSEGSVTNIDESKVRPLTSTGGADMTPGTTGNLQVNGGVTVECVFYKPELPLPSINERPCDTTDVTKTDILTFMTTFQPTAVDGNASGANQVNLIVPMVTAATGRPTTDAANQVKLFTSQNTVSNPAGGVYLCLQSNGSDQHGLLKLGGSNSRFNLSSTISSGNCSS